MTLEPLDSARRGQWLRGVLDLCVLALLAPGESYGYELAQALERAGFGPVQGGTLYPVLLRLERAGLIEAVWRPGETGPARKYYQLTPSGQRELHDSGTAWLGFAQRVESVLTQGGVQIDRSGMAIQDDQ